MNAVFNAYAYIDNYETSENLDKRNDLINIYLRCCCVSLISAKINAGDCDDTEFVLITNIDVPNPYSKLLHSNGIKIEKVDFDCFRFDGNIKWSLAFYKLCAVKYMANCGKYDKILLVDTDTYFAQSIKNIWKEAESDIMLYNIFNGLDNSQSKRMNEEYKMLYGKDAMLVNYGGEFICGKTDKLKIFIKECENVYCDMIDKGVFTLHGDEFILCCAVENSNQKIKAANAYIDRYWTGRRVYKVSTNYYFDAVSILHLPVEKKYGFKKVFDYYLKNNTMPDLNKLKKWFSLPSVSRKGFKKDILKLMGKA